MSGFLPCDTLQHASQHITHIAVYNVAVELYCTTIGAYRVNVVFSLAKANANSLVSNGFNMTALVQQTFIIAALLTINNTHDQA